MQGGRILAAISIERVIKIQHWTDSQFSFATTRERGLRFENGQFVMVGLRVDNRPLLLPDLKPGKRLYLLSTGTGAAPFMSLISDPETYQRFHSVVFVHGVRWVKETAVVRHRIEELKADPYLGELVRLQLIYYPTVTREPYRTRGRLTGLLESGRLASDLGLPPFDATSDRPLVWGSPAMLADTCALLHARGFRISPHIGEPGDYLIE